MANCPDCGSIIMEGDPYCSHCGSHLAWSDEPAYEPPVEKDIFKSMCLPKYKELMLRKKVQSLLDNKYCTGLEVRPYFDSYIFRFTRENEYLKRIDEMLYIEEDADDIRVFSDCESRNYYDGLLGNPKFQKTIKSVGLEFHDCIGGFGLECILFPLEFNFTDEITVSARFRLDETTYKLYRINLNDMSLREVE